MALIATLTDNPELENRLRRAVEETHTVRELDRWRDIGLEVRERAVSCVVIDLSHPDMGRERLDALARFRSDYPRTGVVVVADVVKHPSLFLQLGRLEVPDLVFLLEHSREAAITTAVKRALFLSSATVYPALLRNVLSMWESGILWKALNRLHRGWTADRYALACGMISRRSLSNELRRRRFPNPRRLLVWMRVLQTAHWMGEPARESAAISRQLGYSSPAALFKALRATVGWLPSRLSGDDGFRAALSKFLVEANRGA